MRGVSASAIIGLLIIAAIGWQAFRRLRSLQERRKQGLLQQDEPAATPVFRKKKQVRQQQLQRMESRFWVAETTQQAVKCMVVAWAVTPPAGWMLSHDIRRALVKKLSAHGITTHLHNIQNRPPPTEARKRPVTP